MSIEAELHDGTILEFPDGTPDDVIQQTVKQQMGFPVARGMPRSLTELGADAVEAASSLADAIPGGYGADAAKSLYRKSNAMRGLPDDPRSAVAALPAGDVSAEGNRQWSDKWGKRQDGTNKGDGYLGVLKRPDGNVSTELSVGVEMDGKETEIPTLVPTLTRDEINHLLSGKEATPQIMDKAVAYARRRMAQGKSPFAEPIDTEFYRLKSMNPGTDEKVLTALAEKNLSRPKSEPLTWDEAVAKRRQNYINAGSSPEQAEQSTAFDLSLEDKFNRRHDEIYTPVRGDIGALERQQNEQDRAQITDRIKARELAQHHPRLAKMLYEGASQLGEASAFFDDLAGEESGMTRAMREVVNAFHPDQGPALEKDAGYIEQASRDWDRGVSNLKAIGSGLLSMGGDTVGAKHFADWNLDRAMAHTADAKQNAPIVGTYKNIDSPDAALRYSIEAVMENMPMFLPALVTGGVGAATARTSAEKLVQSAIAKKVAEGMTERAAAVEVAKLVNQKIMLGGMLGAYASSGPMEMGTIYNQVYQDTGERRPGVAAGYGAVAGLFDAFEPALALKAVLGKAVGEEVIGSLVKRIGVESAKQFLAEGGTEAIQTVIEHAATTHVDPSKPIFSPENIDDIIDSALKGGIGGASIGAGSAVMGGNQAPIMEPHTPDRGNARPADDDVSGQFVTEPNSGTNVPNQGTPSAEQQPSQNAGSFDQMDDFARFLAQEKADIDARRQRIAEKQQVQRGARLEEIDAKVADRMAQEAQARRGAVLESVLSDPTVQNPVGKFRAELQRQGFTDTTVSPDEAQLIQSRLDAQAAFSGEGQAAAPETEPSLPNEMPDLVPERDDTNRRQPTATTDESSRLSTALRMLENKDARVNAKGTHIVNRNGAKLMTLREGEAEAIRNSQTANTVEQAAHEAATSPANDLPEPTDAQKEAGNYKKGHVSLQGLDITIENPAGSTRSGVSEDGKAWTSDIAHHYGYVKRTEGADGDHVDVFIGDRPESSQVFVIDQMNPKTGRFDEHKVMLGFDDATNAWLGYHANYEKGWQGAGDITELSMDQFKDWLKNGDTTQPVSERLRNQENQNAVREQGTSQGVLRPEEPPVGLPEMAQGNAGVQEAGMGVRNAQPKTEAIRPLIETLIKRKGSTSHRGPLDAVVFRLKDIMAGRRHDSDLTFLRGKLNTFKDEADVADVIRQAVDMLKPPRQPRAPVQRGQVLEDARLGQSEDLRALAGQAGWAEKGGRMLRDATTGEVTGRTARIPKAPWFSNKPEGVTEKTIQNGVDKAIQGEVLTRNEREAVLFLLDVLEEQNQQPAKVDSIAEALQDEDFADIPFDAGTQDVAAQMAMLGFTQEEIDHETAQEGTAQGEDAQTEPAGPAVGAQEGERAANDETVGHGQEHERGAQPGRDAAQQPIAEQADDGLTSYTNQEVLQREAAAERAKKEAEREPPAKNVIADQVDMFNTQESLFTSNRDEQKATTPKHGTEADAIAQGFTIKAYRGVSKSKPFNDSGTVWMTTSRDGAESYATEVMGYDDPTVLTVMVKPDGLPQWDMRKVSDAELAYLAPDQFGNPQKVGIYQNSDDHMLGGGHNATTIHAPASAVFVVDNQVETDKPEAAPEADLGGSDKEPWQMTRKEFASSKQRAYMEKRGGTVSGKAADSVYGDAYNKHKRLVKDASAEGKQVPSEVLADYPDLKPADPKQSAIAAIKSSDMTPGEKLSTIAAVNKGDVAPEDVRDVVGEKPGTESLLAAHDQLFERVLEGDITLAEFKAAFDALLENQAAIKAELNGMTKDALIEEYPAAARYKSDKKAVIVDFVYRRMMDSFVLGDSISYSYGEKYEDVIRGYVERETDASLAKYAEDVKKGREERAAARAEIKKGLENPQTTEDYQRLLAVRRDEMGGTPTFQQLRMTLTPEQREHFDALAAEKTRGARDANKQARQDEFIRALGEKVGTTEIIKTRHTKHGHDLWQFNLEHRVSGEEFKSLAEQARKLGGNYSSYRGGGAIPGWQFRTEEAAKAFKALVAGDTTEAKEIAQARRDAFADDRSQSAVERLTEMADRLEERADESLSRDRKANTERRARMAASAEAAANSDKAMARTMRNIAAAIDNGTAKFIDRVRQKAQVEMLQGIVHTAQYEKLRKLYPNYADYERHQGERPNSETADYVDFPSFTAYRSDLAGLGRALLETEGTMKLGQRIMKVADDVTDAYLKFAKENHDKVALFRTKDGGRAAFPSKKAAEESILHSGFRGQAIVLPFKRNENLIILSPSEAMKRGVWEGDNDKRITLSGEFGTELVEKIGKAARRGAKVSVPWQFENAYDKRKRLAGMGIETPAELRAALREFIGLREQAEQPSKVKQLERAMIGRRNDGLDFFPTPATVADEMIEAAGIEEGMSVLEPSAGMGHIAERIREAGVEPDVVELSGDRRELLEAKGFNLVGSDFMDVAEGQYDRIIMNPPFSDRRDMQHVQHAYDLLKPGGRLVAIMGEGVFFGQDKKAQAFRDWLDQRGATDEKLEEGTFLDPSLPVNTGVNARMVVIDKPADGDSAFSRADRSDQEGMPVEDVQAVTDLISRNWKNAPRINVVPDWFDSRVPDALANDLDNADARSFAQGALHDGEIWLNASKIHDVDAAKRTLLHEATHFGLRGLFNRQDLDMLMMDLYLGNQVVKAEADRMMRKYGDLSKVRAVEEVLADKGGAKEFATVMDRVVTWFRKQIRKIGFNLELSDAEIRDLVTQALRYVKQKPPTTHVFRGSAFSRGADFWRDVVAAWKMIGNDMDAYKHATPIHFDMREIAREIDPGMRVEEDVPEADEPSIVRKWYITMPDGSHAYIYENDKGMVWLDASRLTEGASGGTKIYLLLGTYAEGNGKVFTGDPQGLSDVALLRRTENMLSLALRYGRTDFLEPHANQENPDKKFETVLGHKVRPLDWKAGDDDHNFSELIRTSYENTMAIAPEIRGVTYNFEKQRFEQDGREFTSADFDRLSRDITAAYRDGGLRGVLARASRATLDGIEGALGRTGGAVAADQPGAQAGTAAIHAEAGNQDHDTANGRVAEQSADVQPGRFIGSATLKRAATTNTVARAARSGSGRDVLAALGGVLRRGLKDTPLQGTVYSRPSPSNGNEARPGTGREGAGADGQATEAQDQGADRAGTEGQAALGELGSAFSRPSEPRIIGDSGRKYSTEQQALFNRVGRTVDHQSTIQRIKEWASRRWVQGIFDQFQPVRALTEKGYTLLRLSKGASGAFEALMHHGKLSIKDGAYDADTSGGVLHEVFFPLGKETTDFLYWIAGNRAERLAAEGRERLFSTQDIAAAKSLSQGSTDFDYVLPTGKVTRDRVQIYKDSLKKFNAFNKNVLDMAEQSGLIDSESRSLWEHEFYVPFYRVIDEQDGGVRGLNIKQGVVRQQAFKKLKGGKEGLNDLLANTLMNWAHLIDASAKNRAARETLEWAELLDVARKPLPGDKSTVWYMNNGKKIELAVDDPGLLDALNGLNFSGLRGPVMTALSRPKHWLTIGVTASPFFKIRNLIRDSVQAISTSDLSYNVASNVVEGFRLTDHERQEYVSALAGGGLIRFGTMLEGNEASRVRQLIKKGAKDEHILDNENKVRAFYDKFLEPAVAAYNELGNRGEEINRMSLYNQLTKRGIDHATASLMARDLLDFSMQGSWTTIRLLTQTVPFFNARLQGLYKLGRSAKENPARLAVVIGATAIASLALLAAYHDDDDWRKREDWDRDNYWWFKFGGVAFRIPKPFEVGAVATLAERSAEYLFDAEMTGKRFRKAVWKILSDQLSMNPIPQAIKPIIDVYANKDSFTGRDIETAGMERLDPQFRYSSRTSMPARYASDVSMGALSPVQIDFLVRSYFGWLGSFAVGAGDMASRAVNDEPTKPTLDYWKLATGGMVSKTDSAGSRYVSQMYDQAKEMESAYATYRQLFKEGKKEAAEKYMTKEDLNVYGETEGAKKAVSAYNKLIRSVEQGDLPADKKRDIINLVRKQQHEYAMTSELVNLVTRSKKTPEEKRAAIQEIREKSQKRQQEYSKRRLDMTH